MGARLEQLEHLEELKAVGFSEEQAKAQLRLVKGMAESELATKLDIARVESEIAAVRSELKEDIAGVKGDIAVIKGDIQNLRDTVNQMNDSLKKDLTLTLGVMLAGTVGAMAGLFKIFGS